MRQFKLINARGVEFDLMRKDAFFHIPDGLGYTVYNEYIVAGSAFVPIASDETQTVIAGEMVFAGYEQYSEFIAYVTDDMTLGYKPQGTTWYYKDVTMQSIGKSEIGSSGRLICPVNFAPSGQWYRTQTFEQAQVDSGAGKVYDYAYPYTYADTEVALCIVQNSSNMYAPCRLHIMGPCSDPQWSLTHNGEVIATGEVNVDIPAGQKLVVDSNPQNMEIGEYTTDNTLVRSVYQLSDFSTGRFLYLPPGESTIRFIGSGQEDINAYVEVREIARTV